VLLDAPKSTTQLVALTGQPLGSVGRHLKILLDAGLLERRRAGRSVLYYRTAVAESLVAAGHDPRAGHVLPRRHQDAGFRLSEAAMRSDKST